jgi:rare lipoprotein A
MASIGCESFSCVGIGVRSALANEGPGARVGNAARLLAVAVTAATLAACAQSSVVTDRPGYLAVNRPASPEPTRKASYISSRHVAVGTRQHTPSNEPAAAPRDASYGVASFYEHDTETASGEKFDARELTAAHRTLPFGTRVRVTNVATGRAVTVRINDRGPYVAGRTVDVSHAAAETLGMVGQGVAKVKLDVVQ